MPEVPVKIYIDKLLKDCSNTTKHLALLSGPLKEKTLRAMADRLAADEEKILSANEKDVDAVGKSFEADVMKDRMKAAVARLRMTADDIKEMVDRLRMIADLPDPVGAVTSRWERPDGPSARHLPASPRRLRPAWPVLPGGTARPGSRRLLPIVDRPSPPQLLRGPGRSGPDAVVGVLLGDSGFRLR